MLTSGECHKLHTTINETSHSEQEIQLKLAFEKELGLFSIKVKRETIQHESGDELRSKDTVEICGIHTIQSHSESSDMVTRQHKDIAGVRDES